jgi:hypothetical protein
MAAIKAFSQILGCGEGGYVQVFFGGTPAQSASSSLYTIVKPLEAAILERTLRTFRLPPALSLSAANNGPQRNGAECGKTAEGR